MPEGGPQSQNTPFATSPRLLAGAAMHGLRHAAHTRPHPRYQAAPKKSFKESCGKFCYDKETNTYLGSRDPAGWRACAFPAHLLRHFSSTCVLRETWPLLLLLLRHPRMLLGHTAPPSPAHRPPATPLLSALEASSRLIFAGT